MDDKVIYIKTVILGAGFAGISAGVNLLKNNYDQFVIFEGLERIGGRVCTEISGDNYYELGAQWIHGQKNNPLFEIAVENNLIKKGYEKIFPEEKDYKFNMNLTKEDLHKDKILQKCNIATTNDKLLFVTQNGKRLPSNFGKAIYDRISKIIGSAKIPVNDQNSNFDIRYGDNLYDEFIKAINMELEKLYNGHNKPEFAVEELRQILNGIFMMRAKRENISAGSGNLFDVSLRHFSAWEEFPGHGYVELEKGYRPIIDAIIKPYKERFFQRLNCKHYMKKIYVCQKLDHQNEKCYSNSSCVHCKFTADASKVVVKVCNSVDANNPRDFYVICDNVLCTMSLGYLKENLNSFIDPLSIVSNERRLAVNRLGFGTINKIFLFYDKPFWNNHLELMHMIWVPEHKNFQYNKLIQRNSNKRIFQEEISKIEVVRSQPNTLSCWIAGSPEFEMLDDKTIATECTKLLRRFLNNQKIPEPTSLKRSKWNTNIFSKGSYSHIPIGGDPNDYIHVAEPLPSEKNPLIMFAGEATTNKYFQSTHGAYITGLRESERILHNSISSRL